MEVKDLDQMMKPVDIDTRYAFSRRQEYFDADVAIICNSQGFKESREKINNLMLGGISHDNR